MDTSKWDWFYLGQIFDVKLTEGDIMADRVDEGPVPLVSSGGTNNGIVKYICEEGDGIAKKFPGNTITIDMFCHAYYQKTNYFAVGHGRVNVLLPKFKMNQYVAMYIVSVLNKEQFKYSYGRAVYSSVAEKIRIKLPVDKKRKPDWVFMEKYVKKMLSSELPSRAYHVWKHTYDITPYTPNNVTLSNTPWDWFLLGDPRLFTIKKGKRLTKADMIEGDIRYIGAIESNNGVSEHISNDEHIHPANTITVSYNGSVAEAFYQNEMFWATDDVNVLYPNFQLNKYIALFITTIIKREKYRFNYGRKWDKELMQKSLIKLPVDSKGNPDWQFMEDYIKSLPYSKNI